MLLFVIVRGYNCVAYIKGCEWIEKRIDWRLSKEEKKSYIKLLTDDLVTLRAKAGIPQDELSRIIGVSRQTYGAIERKDKEMSWNTYLTLLFFFDYNKYTSIIATVRCISRTINLAYQ